MPVRQDGQLGPYTVLEKIGEGGMGEVFKARDTRLNRLVAIKTLPPDKVSDSGRRQRFVKESQAASALNHPNIITIYDWIEEAGSYYLVMEYVPGKTLDHIIPRNGLRLQEALKYAVQIAAALAAAHASGIVHSDIKPSNIMVTEHGGVKILDFGLAKLQDRGEIGRDDATLTARTETAERTVAGSAAYMSPEQAEGKKLDARTDIFSFGALLYEIVTGQRAFQGGSAASTIAAVLKEEPRPAAELAEGLPRELDRIITRCLRKDIERRSQSIAEIKLALEEIKEDTESGMRPAAARRAESVPATRLKGRQALFAAAALGLAGAAVWFAISNRKPVAPRYSLRQLTAGNTASFLPAASSDGKYVVYTSDRGGQRDIWIQPTSGGEPVRLTNNAIPEFSPRFSPDGREVVFNRRTGIFVVSLVGGKERHLAEEGDSPVFSPDGKWIAYRSYPPGKSFGAVVWIIPAAGGAARKVYEAGLSLAGPIWSPDGAQLLVSEGRAVRTAFHASWRLIPVRGGASIPVQGMEQVWSATLQPYPKVWLANGNRVVFGTWFKESHVWFVGLSSGGKIERRPLQVTYGTHEHPGPSSADGGVIPFTNVMRQSTIYSLAVDADRGVSNGEPKLLLNWAGDLIFPSVTRDGKKMVFASDRSGNFDIWLRDNVSGEETAVVATPAEEKRGMIAPDGSKLAFDRFESNKRSLYWMPLPAGPEYKICDDALSLLGWTPDGKGVLISLADRIQLVVHDLESGARVLPAVHPKSEVHTIAFSPDSHWFVFKLRESDQRATLYVSPWKRDRPTRPEEWIPISGQGQYFRPLWSPDGNTVYCLRRDDFEQGMCLFARRLDPVTKQPRGEEFAVRHFHDRLRPGDGQGLGPNTLYLPMYDGNAHIWVAELLGVAAK
ncbi:MAG: protein kinase [Bryobacteraceae bacterium]|nr:protein kinase [Bryobacteraceae bacterium]